MNSYTGGDEGWEGGGVDGDEGEPIRGIKKVKGGDGYIPFHTSRDVDCCMYILFSLISFALFEHCRK